MTSVGDSWRLRYLVYENPEVIIPQLEAWKMQITSDDTDIYKKYAILTALQPLAQYLPVDNYDAENKEKIQGLIQGLGMEAAKMFGN